MHTDSPTWCTVLNLIPACDAALAMTELNAVHARQLQKRPEDLARMASDILKSRLEAVRRMERGVANVIDHDFNPEH